MGAEEEAEGREEMKGGLIVVAGMYLVGFLWIVRTRGGVCIQNHGCARQGFDEPAVRGHPNLESTWGSWEGKYSKRRLVRELHVEWFP